MAAVSGSLLILGVVVVVFVALAMGCVVGWHLRGVRGPLSEDAPPPASPPPQIEHPPPAPPPAEAAVEPEQVRQLLDQLQRVTDQAASGVGEHSSRVEKITQHLASLCSGKQPLEQVALLDAAQQLLQANERLRQELQDAKGQLQDHAKTIETHMAEARTDGLCGVANRRAFNEELARRIEALQEEGRGFSLILLDIDHFKRFNDTFGHQAGDEVLRSTGKVLSECVRDCDFVARYGGEEFAVLVPDVSFFDAQAAAEQLRAAVAAKRVIHQGRGLQVTASLGVAEARPGQDMESLINGADEALYAAKENGRNRAYFFNGQSCEHIDPKWFEENRDMIQQVERQIDEGIRTGQPIDRRNQPRRPFPTSQFIAPCAKDQLPAREAFRQVPCHDISAGGFSFLLPEPPDFEDFVVALGAPPSLTYLAACVVHARLTENGPAPMYLIGCRFTGRVDMEPGEAGEIVNTAGS